MYEFIKALWTLTNGFDAGAMIFMGIMLLIISNSSSELAPFKYLGYLFFSMALKMVCADLHIWGLIGVGLEVGERNTGLMAVDAFGQSQLIVISIITMYKLLQFFFQRKSQRNKKEE